MHKVLCCFIAVSLLFVVGESLVCKTCKQSLLGKCLKPSDVTCEPDQNCFVGKSQLNGALDFIGFKTLGCLATEKCPDIDNGTMLGFTYTTTYYCCNTDLCTPPAGGSTVHLSLAAGATLLFSLWNSMRC